MTSAGNSQQLPIVNKNVDYELVTMEKRGTATPPIVQNTPPALRRNPTSKKSLNVQFSQPEVCINQIPGPSNRFAPSRKREEAIVMANLRKRVAECDLTRSSKPLCEREGFYANNDIPNEENGNDNQDSRPLLSPKQVVTPKRENSGDDLSKPYLQDKDFILDCLCWHNEFRARHNAPALIISPELCEYAYKWAQRLAETNEFHYRTEVRNIGQNLFCCPANALLTDFSGQEVATYWYSTIKRYNYFKGQNLLHTNVNAGHFTQMVWVGSRYFGVSKAISKTTGKIFIVAYYFPAGNVVGKFQQNVLPPIIDDQQQQNDADINQK